MKLIEKLVNSFTIFSIIQRRSGLLIAGPNIDVIRWGATLANMPDSQRISELGNRFGYMPLLFTRAMEVDEIDSPLGSRGWTECPPGDFYPCLGIDFTGGSTGTQQIHFDTGAVKTFLSLSRLEDAGVAGAILPIDIRPGRTWSPEIPVYRPRGSHPAFRRRRGLVA